MVSEPTLSYIALARMVSHPILSYILPWPEWSVTPSCLISCLWPEWSVTPSCLISCIGQNGQSPHLVLYLAFGQNGQSPHLVLYLALVRMVCQPILSCLSRCLGLRCFIVPVSFGGIFFKLPSVKIHFVATSS